MSASIKSGRCLGKALTLRLFKRKSPPAITPLESPMIFTGTSIVISLSSKFEKESICKIFELQVNLDMSVHRMIFR
jgi:hypothetical protein